MMSCRRTWNATILTLVATSQNISAFRTFLHMRLSGLHPDPFALAAVIKSSASSDRILSSPASLHAFSIRTKLISSLPPAKALMHVYAVSISLSDAVKVFDEMGYRDTVSWNVILSGHARMKNMVSETMVLFHSMYVNARPNPISIAVILPACARVRALVYAENVHGYVVKAGMAAETLVGNALVSMYAKCGVLISGAVRAFEDINFKDVVSWNSLIAGYAENGFFEEAARSFVEMAWNNDGVRCNYATVVSVLPLCGFLGSGGRCLGKAIHSHVFRLGLDVEVTVGNALLSHYARVGDETSSGNVFAKMAERDIVSWNTRIAGFAMNGSHKRALELYRELLSVEIDPDSVTLITVLPVCAHLREVTEGRKIHDYVRSHAGLCQNTTVANALVSFYGKCGDLDAAFETFAATATKDLISWNAMLTAYAHNQNTAHLFAFFNHMLEEQIMPDSVTILTLLQASSGDKSIREVHGYSIRTDILASSPLIPNALLNAYVKCGNIKNATKTFEATSELNPRSAANTLMSAFVKHGYWKDAEAIFNSLEDRDLGTWNLMVQAYAKNDCFDQAVATFHGLQIQAMLRPDALTIMSILPACTSMTSDQFIKQCHGHLIRGSLLDIRLKGALLDAYAKSGKIEYAYNLFTESNSLNDVITYTAMVSGFAMNGMAEAALQVFSEMINSGIKPDHIVMTTLLSACSHAGLVDEGFKHFESIHEIHGIEPTMEHYACVTDLLARRGRLKEAYTFAKSMPFPANASVWGAVLGASEIHGEVEIGRLAAEHLFRIEDGNVGNYVVMSNIYAGGGKWGSVEKLRAVINSKHQKKPVGCSWID